VSREVWSGNTGWFNYQFTLLAGTNVLEWRYTKDFALSAGEDAAWIDNIALPVAITPAPAGRLQVLSIGAQLALRLEGETGRQYVIEVSPDLRNWTALTTNTAVDGTVVINDLNSPSRPTRFYRAVSR
jgi:hypothetical protein